MSHDSSFALSSQTDPHTDHSTKQTMNNEDISDEGGHRKEQTTERCVALNFDLEGNFDRLQREIPLRSVREVIGHTNMGRRTQDD